ncbi:uncharacterized protein LOC141853622 isoform X2 [Brevipalpus obovatus]|uniref:uncharacterized protein LOC141853622 isoform X2 n=1 Tax=Brevipalpus obovatus TaxID=246614 RepID=UPI003D9FA014
MNLNLIGSVLIIIMISSETEAIRCYQCSSDENKTLDDCGAYAGFDSEKVQLVDCMSEDAVSPGTFCFKSIQQGPRGFIWDGRWRTVIRRCAQVTESGVSWGCAWGYKENGVYYEECYCARDGCNGAQSLTRKSSSSLVTLFLTLAMFFIINV